MYDEAQKWLLLLRWAVFRALLKAANDGAELPEVLMCPRCREQFTDVQEYLSHKAECDKKAIKHDDPAHSDPEDMVVSEDDEEEIRDDDTGGKRLERMRRHRQDAANNNSVDENGEPGQPLGFPFPVPPAAPGHVTLEALQNTKVAVAQFAATAMANNTDNEAALQELAVLQSTLFTLQHQQVLQLQLINQLQQQLQIDRVKEEEVSPDSPQPSEHEPENAVADSPPAQPQIPSPEEPVPPVASTPIAQAMTQPPQIMEVPPESCIPTSLPPQIQPPLCSISSSLASTIITHSDSDHPSEEPNTLEMLQKRAQEVLDNASQGLLATNLADELAFRKSKGAMSPYDSKGRNEPFFKHRCRYCGKVFGSDSALQIHIRSHTGERPYKCNVCGSRFTTKGNLKVHFQRHSQKFPHIKMNPNPVPEHLDKYHPPLLAQLGQQPSLSPGGPPHPPHLGFPGGHPFQPTSLPLFRHQPPPPPELLNNRLQPSPHRIQEPPPRLFPPHPLFLKREEQDAPADLSKPQRSPTPVEEKPQPIEQEQRRESTEEQREQRQPDRVPQLTPKAEPGLTDNEVEQEQERYPSPIPYDECSNNSSKYSNEEMMEQRSPNVEQQEQMQDEPENLSNRSNSISIPLSISTAGQRLPGNFSFGHPASSPPSSTSSGSLGNFPTTPIPDITKDPAIYTNLLPRPGSNDNSWESLIEVTKTSETSKLQQLVDNIEHKLSDPNQCVICHRVLSCKSALQMHYRTHTGERPFKCKICGRAFTTKGNLKTHMGVHRAKPPMRVLHQCPVCHKKFTNALVLQQHIRLHTGEPTDLTPEQIQAAEIKDFPSPGGFPALPNSMHPFLSQGFPIPGLSPLGHSGMPLNMKFERGDVKSEHESLEDDEEEDDDMSTTENQHLQPFAASSPTTEAQNVATSVSAMLSQYPSGRLSCPATEDRTSVATSPSQLQNGEKSPEHQSNADGSPAGSEAMLRASPNHTTVQIPRPPSSQQASSPTPSDTSQSGALDLTPRNSSQQQSQPQQAPQSAPHSPPIPAVSATPPLFPTFGLLPQGGGQPPPPPLMTSALSSLTSSVLTSTSFSPLRLAVGPVAGRGNTTCNLCFKTFACHSALEIHFRSHTKERPFKCTVCDRGFSTKGNMKQHMLTHKIRDMPQHMFDNKPPGHPAPPSLCSDDSSASLPPTMSSAQPLEGDQPPPVQQQGHQTPPQQPAQVKTEPDGQQIKREPTETELPLPKRPPSSHGHPHVEQRGLEARATHVPRPAAHSDDPQGLRIPATEARPLLSIPTGSIP
ncbi:unnamed protein product [Acanthoscelides obtectus]|uniref:Homeotic protein spalt-major n=1 Tax=Acanthoscelides obtectus TaxID=200917 RepID=A0A9P0LZB6_ACAOB|nr:unnamed protein product [Acanthoscelides obtectus]CAK1652575.1 Homeotic protein spalt-major [Acanthoscelides obtectus]